MITISNVSRKYVMGGDTIHALHDVSLTIKEGEFVSLIGPSGSGKTTLLNMIGGLERPSEGEIEVNGHSLGKLRDKALSQYRAKELGYVFQTFNLLARYTVLKNVMIPAILNGTARSGRKDAALEALRSVGLEDKARYLPNKLSGGERQRVALARALMHNPSIILADEPTGNLDERNADLVMDLLVGLCREQGRTLILVTHNPELAKKADRIIELKNGEVVKGKK